MLIYTMIKNKKSNKYYILENGVKVKNDIFDDEQDFINELSFMGIENYKIIVE